MSALLYKDLMVIWKNGKMLLALMFLFMVIGAAQLDESYYLVFPAVAICTMSINSLSYDERYGWNRFSDTMPYGRKRIVSSKYLLSLLCTGAATALYFLAGAVFGLLRGGFQPVELFGNLMILVTISTVYTVLLLPLAFQFGMEKARIAYIIVICAVLVVAMNFYLPMTGLVLPAGLAPKMLLPLALPVYAALWVISWSISVKIYQKKEL